MLATRRTRAAVSVVSVLVALGAAGCGGTDSTRPADGPAPTTTVPAPVRAGRVLQARLVRSVARTTAEHSAHTSISVTLTGLGDDALANGAFDIAGTGVVDLVNGDADLDVTIPQFQRLGGGMEQRIVGGVVYTKLPPAALRAAGIPVGVSWLRLDPTQVGSNASAFSQAQADPAGQLAFVSAASDDVRTVGADTVRGVPVTHYETTIQPATASGPRDLLAAVQGRLAPLAPAIGRSPVTVDVWIDRSGCPRRVVVSIPLTAARAAGGLAGLGPDAMLRIQGDFFGFGAAVKVVAPPAGQIRPYSLFRLDAVDG